MRGLTIGKRIVISLWVLWTLGSQTLVFLSYGQAKSMLILNIRTRVQDYATVGALSFSGDDHALLIEPASAGTEAYARVFDALVRVAGGEEISSVYTIRKTEGGGIAFIVDPDPDATTRLPVGSPYDDASDLLQSVIGGTDVTAVEEDFYTDQWGTVLSAYAPIYTAEGKFDGLFGVDISAESVNRTLNRLLLIMMALCAGITILIVPGAMFLARSIVLPIRACVRGQTKWAISPGHTRRCSATCARSLWP